MRSFFIISFLSLCQISHAQTVSDLLDSAREAYIQAAYAEAIELSTQAIERFQLDHEKEEEVSAYFLIVQSQLKLNRFDEAERSLQKIERLNEEINESETDAALKFWLGRLEAKKGNDESAVILLDEAISLAKEPERKASYLIEKGMVLVDSHSLIEAGEVYPLAKSIIESEAISDTIINARLLDFHARIKWHTGDFSAALRLLKQELVLRKAVLPSDHPEIGGVYASIGIMYKNLLQYDKALEYYILGLEIRKRHLGERHLEVSHSLNNIGYMLYKQDQFEEALEMHRKALDIRQEHLDSLHLRVLQSIEHIGLCYGGLEKYEEAEKHFRQILYGRVKKYGHDHHLTGYALYNLGAVAVEIPDYQKAADYFLEAVKIGLVAYDAYNYDQADNYNRLANCLLKLHRAEEAIYYFHLGLECNLPGYKWNKDPASLPEVAYYLSFREVMRSLLGLAKAHAVNKSQMGKLSMAVNYLHEAERLIDKFKKNFTNEGDLITISSSSKELAVHGVAIYGTLYQENPREEYLNEIFRYTELAKASALLSKLSDQKAKTISGIPELTLEKDKNYRHQQDSLNSQIISMLAGGRDEVSDIRKRLFELNREYESFTTELEKKYPLYTERKFGLKPATKEAVQKYLADRDRPTALLNFFLTEEGQLYTTLITSENSWLINNEVQNIGTLATSLRNAIQDQDQEEFVYNSKLLYELLLAQVDQHVPNSDLIIVPDGILGYIPFDILMNDSNHYLIEDHVISYDLSASLLVSRIHKNASNAQIMAYAPHFQVEADTDYTLQIDQRKSIGFTDLPGARREVKLVNQIFNGEAKIGKEASEWSFKNEADAYTILHFATHSIINEKNPEYSKLLFTEIEDEEDGFLHAFELENLTLNADLVTLSACNTGIGKIAEGEGVMSLARSFSTAGVPSVVMSLWPASDKSTPELMKLFYGNLQEGQAKDEALSNAKKEYLRTAVGKARYPYYWGGFVLVGDNSALDKDRNLWLWVSLGMIILLAAIIYWRTKKLV